MRYSFASKNAPNAPFGGFGAEVGYDPCSGDAGCTDSSHGTSVYLTFSGNAGCRWRFDRFIVNAGGLLGVAPTAYSRFSCDAAPTLM